MRCPLRGHVFHGGTIGGVGRAALVDRNDSRRARLHQDAQKSAITGKGAMGDTRFPLLPPRLNIRAKREERGQQHSPMLNAMLNTSRLSRSGF